MYFEVLSLILVDFDTKNRKTIFAFYTKRKSRTEREEKNALGGTVPIDTAECGHTFSCMNGYKIYRTKTAGSGGVNYSLWNYLTQHLT